MSDPTNELANHLCDVDESWGFNCGHGYEIAERILADPQAHVEALVKAGVLRPDWYLDLDANEHRAYHVVPAKVKES